jgi:hypothetical protein
VSVVNHHTELRAFEDASGVYRCVVRDLVVVDETDVVPLLGVIVFACDELRMRGLAEKVGISQGLFKGRPAQPVAVILGALSVRIRPTHEKFVGPARVDEQSPDGIGQRQAQYDRLH